MHANRLKQLWNNGKPALNGWLSTASPFTAELMAEQGYDSLCIDMQHGLIGYADSLHMLQAMRASQVVPLVRVPWLDPAHIMKALDAGAYGIICPMISNREQAEALVSYMRYPPQGARSSGPTRAGVVSGANYGAEADEQLICLAMIETREAVENLEEIVATPGLDGVYIGPVDLTLALAGKRLPVGFDRTEPEMVEVIQRILATAHKAGIRAGLHCGSPTYAAKAVEWGFDIVTVSNDVRLLATAAAASVKDFRRMTGQNNTQPAPETQGGGY
ncbi:2,4-dihydroxyhept-2-ene-1,7-dioic acid aldolase [Pusillimonas sp. TS35]|jgi:4-hydroxy-2-oxoheptanedioate aldolase|uniref:HpcH/HpaI aldolase family protein n=1 Tax=Paracandidimonas lactea TaxID=2895524 RepID=UPI00136EE664|nr:aldolase/citrate lyase family protein [Paracandidimonas lactea]MYN13303.1 2,4-dihydroxyhept-2-ene-1,7-dioic acid aldolase [Pusillimonas sp. TS35]